MRFQRLGEPSKLDGLRVIEARRVALTLFELDLAHPVAGEAVSDALGRDPAIYDLQGDFIDEIAIGIDLTLHARRAKTEACLDDDLGAVAVDRVQREEDACAL